MDCNSPFDFNPTSGGVTLQPSAPQPNAAGGPAFANRFHELMLPLEELMAEWRVVCQGSPELAQETLSLLNHSGNLTETRYTLINSIFSSVGAQSEEYYAPPALQYDPPPPPRFQDIIPPSTTLAFPSAYDMLHQQQQHQPWIGMTLVDPPAPSMFTAILKATEEFSSLNGASVLGGSGSVMLDTSMTEGAWAEPCSSFFPSLQLPTPLSTPTTPSPSHTFPWPLLSPASSSSINTPSSPTPVLYTSPSIPSPSRPSHLPPLNNTPLYLLVQFLPPPPGDLNWKPLQPEMHELKVVDSEPLGGEGGGGRLVRLAWFEQGSKTSRRDIKVVQREGDVELKPHVEGRGGDSEQDKRFQILFFDIGTYSVPSPTERGVVQIGSGDWWRVQVCFGRHPLSPIPSDYWTSTTAPPGHKTRKHRVLTHFNTCTKGSSSIALQMLARVLIKEGKKRG